jgi:hypothetical protein
VEAQERVAREGWKPHPERVNVSVVVFTYDGKMAPGALVYCTKLFGEVMNRPPEGERHPRVNVVSNGYSFGYPTDRCRNAVVKGAREAGAHFLLMLDNDMRFDANLGADPAAKPFLTSSLDFALEQPAPCFVGAPYCAGPPAQEVVIMKHREYAPDMPGGLGKRLDKFTRDEAAVATGIERVAALPTGCVLMDLRAFDVLPPPWFYYEYLDPPYNTALASTEDVVLTRNADWLGVNQYVNWDAWANHVDKGYEVTKPRLCPVDSVPRAIWESFQAGAKPRML